jgi:hypothetical protein
MAEPKTPRLKTEWNEIEPTVFERKSFSLEETARWNQRPNDLIKSALRFLIEPSDEKSS